MRWMDEKLPLPRLVYNAVGAGYPVPRNLNYFWNFGVLAGAALAIQIVTGIVLAMHYAANGGGGVRFGRAHHARRQLRAGCCAMRTPTARSMFFIVVYIHIFRGLYYGSYKAPREMVWLLGVVIFLLMMATAFMGYVLPWGQMSFWGAQVITGFFSAIPLVGEPMRAVAARRLRARQRRAQPLLLAALSAAVRDRGGDRPAHLGAAHPGLEQPDRRRREGPAGYRAVPPLLHRQGRLRRSACS